MALVHFNRLFVSEPCLYIKIMSEWEGKEVEGPRGASEGFHSSQIETPSAGQAPRTEYRQLDPSMLKSGDQVRDMGSSHSLQAVEDASPRTPHPVGVMMTPVMPAKCQASQTTSLTLTAHSEVSHRMRKCQN